MLNDMRYLSPPVRVFWMGWQSDTATLGRYDWDLSVMEDTQIDRVQIALRHNKARIYGMSEVEKFNYYDRDPAMIRELQFRMTLANEVRIHMMNDSRLWTPSDTKPFITDEQVTTIEDMRIFRALPPEDRDIILPPPSFDQILQMALEHQAPKQKELREKARRLRRGDQIIRVAA